VGWPEEARAALLHTLDNPAPVLEEDSMAIIDAIEQRVALSQDKATQKAHYSRKKKARTRKTVRVVNAHERLR